MMSWFSRLALLSLALVCWLNGCAQKSAPLSLGNGSVAQKPLPSQISPNDHYNQANQNIGGSRLDSQPWPANMGQPIPPGGASTGIAAGVASNTPMPPIAPPVANPNGAKVKVAVLLPLTGRSAALGQAMLNAAQQAVFDVAGPNFELMPRDTGDSESGADIAARDALASGAQLFIGPLFGAQIPAVRKVAQIGNLNVLSLSTDVAQAGQGVYIMGFAPAAQVERVTHFAVMHGLKRFAALVPNNAYGQLVGPAFQAAAAHEGATVIVVQTYDPDAHDLDAQTRNLLAYRNQVDAFFLPEGGNDLARINAQLVAAGLDPHGMRLLGTGLWDVPDLGAQDPAIVGGLYAASDSAARRGFVSAYQATYGQEPPRLATLAYDATALAAVIAKHGARYDTAALTNPNGFAGLDGIFRLTSSGAVERAIAVDEVTPDGAKTIDPAPTSFVGWGQL